MFINNVKVSKCAFYYSLKMIITLNSKEATPKPLAAPEPANPIKCSLPMFVANKEAPT